MADLGQIGSMNGFIGGNMPPLKKLNGQQSDSQSEDCESSNDHVLHGQ